FGLSTRAAAENERGASLIGLSATRIGTGNWIVATVLAGLAGILIAPVSTVDPTTYTLFIVPALGCALVARFTNFGVAAATGLALGMFQSEVTKLLGVWTWLPQRGVPEALPFILIVIAMTIFSRGVGARGDVGEASNPSLGRPARPYATTALCFAAGLVVLLLLSGSLLAAFISSLVYVCLALSLVVLTGYAGQVSLAQMSFAGLSGFEIAHLSSGIGLGFP